MEGGVCGDLGVLATPRQGRRKEQENVTTQHLVMVVHHVQGPQLSILYVLQVIYTQVAKGEAS